ncbi:MAG TPA: TerC/Alx family metal homeostasis membrane protein [Myxococcales bacterium]|nr:TerC/Alx family metal homeostasis membrane protein [Myxococcales bacterium]
MNTFRIPNATRTAGWVAVAVLFGAWVGVTRGGDAAGNYFAAYLVELSLSIDNVFVFAVIFLQLHIPPENQRRVLLAGIAGAFVLRAVAIVAGITLLNRFQWIIYPFAGLIILGALRLLFGEQRQRRVVEQACDVCGTWVARFMRVSPVLVGNQFLRRERGGLVATPLFVALLVIETTDIVFALDSVPAVLSITRDPLLAYGANVMAMLGLRSLYFVLSDALHRLRYLRQGLALILLFTGLKMLSGEWIHIGPTVSIAVVLGVLAITAATSLATSPRRT